MKRVRSILPLGILPALLILGGTGLVFAQGAYNHAAFEKEMEDAGRRIRVVLGGLIAEDWTKAQTEAAALAAQAASIRKLTPKVEGGKIALFQADADSLAVRATRLAALARAKDGPGAARELGQVVETCVSCHAVFRK